MEGGHKVGEKHKAYLSLCITKILQKMGICSRYKHEKEFVPNLDVLWRLAEAFSANDSMKKTHIHFASRVSWNSYDRYLDWLRNRNYIERIPDKSEDRYELTERGREMVVAVLKFKEIMESATPVPYQPKAFQ